MEKIVWTDRVRNEVLQRVKEEMNSLQRTKRRKADWIGHILCRNCLLKLVEGKIEETIKVTGRRRRRRKQLLGDLKAKRGYLKLKEEALGHPLWKIRFRKSYGSVVRQNEFISTFMSNCDEKRLKVVFMSWNRERNSCRRT
jgi:hypothetical protein